MCADQIFTRQSSSMFELVETKPKEASISFVKCEHYVNRPLREPLMGFSSCMICLEICITCKINRSPVIIMQSERSFTT